MFLADRRAGEKVRIADTSRMNELVKRRLLDFGIMEGSAIEVKRILPLGGPIAIEAGGQLIGIRRSDAKLMMVEVV